jgi:hypothetical protein
MVPTRVLLQGLHEPSISKALAKATKVSKPSQETPPPNKSITESPEVMEVYSDWRTPFMLYLKIGGLPEDKVRCECLRRWVGQYTLISDELS